jgi:two-component system cell cycle sensor histidine kinase PleC
MVFDKSFFKPVVSPQFSSLSNSSSASMPFQIQNLDDTHDSESAYGAGHSGVINHSDQSIARVAIGADGHILFANTEFCDICDLDEKSLKSQSALTFMRLTTGKKLTKTAFKTLESGLHDVYLGTQKTAFRFHFDWLTTPDKKKVLIGCQSAYESLDDDFFAGTQTDSQMEDFAAQVVHMTREKTPEDHKFIIESASDNSIFTQMSHDIMTVISPTGEIVSVNEHFYDILGFSDADIAHMSFEEIFEPDTQDHMRSLVSKMKTAKKSVEFTSKALTKFGDTRWVEWQFKTSGEHIYCVGRDITAIKRHEKALLKREKQLMQAEAIGRMGHWHWRVGDEKLEWSDEIFSIFGVERETFSPAIEKLNSVVHKRDLGKVLQAFQRALIQKNDYDMEFRITTPSGDIRFIRCEGRCQIDENGEVTGLYGIMQDMTDRILYERELHTAKDEAERSYAAKTQFLANMSHELRTPLNAIIGFSEMMQRQLLGPIGTEKYLEYIGGIRESGEHLLDLISDILDMSKIEAGKYDLELEEINVAKTIRLATHMMEGRAMEASVKISTATLTESKKKLVCDRRAFMQIMLNLMSNAVKFTPEGGRIDITCTMKKEGVHIAVIDNGIGIPANKLNTITRPFEQVSSSYTRDHDGSGLGLAITKELIGMHGGALDIESIVDKGTSVFVTLPYKPAKA